MDSRTIILQNIKRNLAGVIPKAMPSEAGNDTALPATRDQLLSRFTAELQRVDGEVITVRTHDDAIQRICSIAESAANPYVMISNDPILAGAGYVGKIKNQSSKLSSVTICSKINIHSLPTANFSIVAGAWLIAETGTAALVSSAEQPRTLALLPETVFIVAEISHLLPDISSAIEQLSSRNAFSDASAVTFVTGPSRTADIEKTLVRGVHGPKRLIVVIVGA